MNRAKFWLGVLWASPVTSLMLLYTSLFVMLGWYRSLGRVDLALVYVLTDSAPAFLKKLWKKWGGHAGGNVIVLKKAPDLTSKTSMALLVHEMTHVKQSMILGPFVVVYYGVNMLFGYVLEKTMGHFDAYYDNPAESHARRCAGQVVDVVGLVEKLKSQNLTKN